MRQRYGSADYRAATGTLRQVLVKAVGEDGRYGDALAAFPARSSWCGATHDTAAPLAGGPPGRSSAAIGGSSALAGVDHFTPQRAPEELRAALLPPAAARDGQPGHPDRSG